MSLNVHVHKGWIWSANRKHKKKIQKMVAVFSTHVLHLMSKTHSAFCRAVRAGVLAVAGHTWSRVSASVGHLASALQLPMLTSSATSPSLSDKGLYSGKQYEFLFFSSSFPHFFLFHLIFVVLSCLVV